MTTLEDRLRGTLHDMADEAVAVPLLQRLENRPEVHPGRHRLVAVAAAAVAAAVAATTSYVVLRGNEPSIVEPVDRPPKVIRLADTATAAPGRVQLAVTLAPADANGFASTYAVGADGGPATLVPQSKWVPRSHTAHLTLDGTRLVWQLGDAAQPRLEVVNLRTGARDTLGGALGYCPQLSPDGRTIAMWGTDDERPALLDTRTRSQRPGPFDPALDPPVAGGSGCAGFGWSPDGRILLVPLTLGSLVSAPDGPIQHRLPDRYAVNGTMSWSPDGRLLLLYDKAGGRFVVHEPATGQEWSLGTPREARRPQGWTGSRVVWLTGQPGNQRLVTTDQRGDDARTWSRFEVGDRVVDSVSWSRELSGTARD